MAVRQLPKEKATKDGIFTIRLRLMEEQNLICQKVI